MWCRSDLALKNGLLSLRTRLLKELQKWNDASHWGVDAIADALQAWRYDEAKEGLLDIVRRYDAGAVCCCCAEPWAPVVAAYAQ